MMRIFFSVLFMFGFRMVFAQPAMVNSAPYGQLGQMGFDSLTEKLYVNYLYGCPSWNTPCAYSYSLFSQHNLINKHSFYDNTLSSVEASNYQAPAPSFPINNYNSGLARACIINKSAVYTNFGYCFNKRDTNFATINPAWSYSPSLNPSFKELSTFELKGDSVVFFEKDSTSGINYYTAFILNANNGADVPYTSIHATSPFSMFGSIKGHVRKSVRINDRILLAGAFTASVLGTQIARNIVAFNINTGALESVPLNFAAGTDIYDIEIYRNKIWICGKFQTINGLVRKNFAVINTDFTLNSATLSFEGVGNPNGVYVDAFEWYHDFLIAKGNFNSINGDQLSLGNNYWIKVFDTKDSVVKPWNFNLPGTPQVSDYMFQLFRQKLYIKNRSSFGSPLNIYCFEPVRLNANVIVGTSVSDSIKVCAPGTLQCKAPFKFAQNYYWNYSGTGLNIQNQGSGQNAVISVSTGATSGILSVEAVNDCGLSTQNATVFITVNQKPDMVLLSVNPRVVCNPDSSLLSGASTNTNASISWRKATENLIHIQPYYTKIPGTYFMMVEDTVTGCSDSNNVVVTEDKHAPNALLLSHNYSGVTIAVDTITCSDPVINVTGGSDTSGVTVFWRSLQNDSIYSNPVSAITGGYYKLIVSRAINGCADSSLFVLVAENKNAPTVSIAQPAQELNCSNYHVVLNAHFLPAASIAEWYDTTTTIGNNPIVVDNPGEYRIKITNPVNGCVSQDSIFISSNTNFYFQSSADTLICKNSPVNLYSNVTGTVANVNYSWNGIAGTNSMLFQPVESTTFIISATSGACEGHDTVIVKIPPEITDSIVTLKSCSDPTSGTLVVFASGGRAPHEFSIDGGLSFSTAGVFSNIAFGTYSIVIKDSMNCVRQATAALNAFSNLPEPKWLSSTINTRHDTLVLVDISIPKPDSVHWMFPSQIAIVGGDMFNPVVTMGDTGTVKITMTAYYGTCVINSEKWIRFGEQDSLNANFYNDNSIVSLVLFPNPNAGLFTAEVHLAKKQNVVLQIWDNSGNIHYQNLFFNSTHVIAPINVQFLQNGSYYLRVISEFDATSKPFIINK